MPEQEHEIPRETFIALRARREAYRIASDVLYEKGEESPQSVLPLSYGRRRRHGIQWWIRAGAMALLTMMAFLALLAFAMAVGSGVIQLPGK